MKLLPLLVLPLAFLTPATQAAVSPKVQKAEAKAFARADKDDDDAISYDEFKALFKPLAVALKKFPATGRGDDPEELLEICNTLFVWFDQDNSEGVTFAEWLAIRQEFDTANAAAVLGGLPGLDRNGDGQVLLREFLPLVKCFLPKARTLAWYRQILADYVEEHGSTTSGVVMTMGGFDFNISMGISESWAERDPAAFAAWIARLQEAEANRPIPTLPEGTVPEEGEGRRGR